MLIASVRKRLSGATAEQISHLIRELRGRGLIDGPAARSPLGLAEVHRYKISPPGIEHLSSLEKGLDATGAVESTEARMVGMYDRIKADMESMRKEVEAEQKALEVDMGSVRASIAEHDQVIRTYFVRVIETFGVFVGIFAVVVVAIIGTINVANLASQDAMPFSIVLLVALPAILVTVIVALLYAIRELVLKAPRA